MLTLYVIHHSPWSERARWALLHHKLRFEEREHVPLIGELSLRMRAKNTRGKVSVPLLVDDGGESVQGSLAIGERADRIGKRAKLFPEGSYDRIHALYDALEDAMNAGRERFTRDLMNDEAAQMESLPPFLRKMPLAGLSARVGTTFIVNKYRARIGSVDDRIRAGLRAAREALGGKPYVLGEFSFADVLAASVVQVITPEADKYLPFPPATRALWRHDKLVKEFGELVEWRDALYAKHRPVAKA